MQRAALLIVEDDPAIRQLLAETLGERYTVRTATCAAEALKLLAIHRPDLVFSDCLLPDGGISRLLGLAKLLDIPVVLTSGDPDQMIEHDGYAFLVKPYRLQKLLAVIAHCLAECSIGGAAAG